MDKKGVLWAILDLIFLIVFNTVFFVAGGTEHTASVWISYGFIHFAYLMVLVTPRLVRKSSSAAVFGFALTSISSVYFLVEFAVGLIFVFMESESFKAALIVQIIIAGLYAIVLVAHMLANESTADSLERHEDEVAFIKTASSRVKPLLGKARDKKADKAMEKAYDLIHSSPSRSSPAVHALESAVMSRISDLADAVQAGNVDLVIATAGEIISAMEERNRKLRLAN